MAANAVDALRVAVDGGAFFGVAANLGQLFVGRQDFAGFVLQFCFGRGSRGCRSGGEAELDGSA